MDEGTAKDFIEDLTAEVEFWRTTAQKALDNADKALEQRDNALGLAQRTLDELHAALKLLQDMQKAVHE